jgi:hypothetical protein
MSFLRTVDQRNEIYSFMNVGALDTFSTSVAVLTLLTFNRNFGSLEKHAHTVRAHRNADP